MKPILIREDKEDGYIYACPEGAMSCGKPYKKE